MSDHDQAPAPGRSPAGGPATPEVIIPEIFHPDSSEPAAGADNASSDHDAPPLGEGPGTRPDDPPVALTVEDLIEQLEAVTRERDGHFDARARLQAEFDNYRKRTAHQHGELVERAAQSLVEKLLPVLDACDAAMALSVSGAEPIAAQLVGVLEKEGLSRIDALEQPFDPEVHEAVIHEPADTTDSAHPTVVDVLRTGYLWRSRVIRPAMVKVRG